MRAVWPLLFLISAGCSHGNLRAPTGDGIYPFGKYQHNVKIKTLVPSERTMELRGVVSYSAEAIKVVGLSSFGTTVFRIDENLKTGEIKKEFQLEVLRQHQDRFMEFYQLIRTLITAAKGVTDFKHGPAHFILSDPDDHLIYRKIHIDHPHVVLDIAVTEYEF